jgi:NADPH2:quinone reductase
MTAHRCLFADGPSAGKWILVTGGAGVVAHYAIQLAKWAGANVVATVSSEAKADHARAAGADVIVNYRTENVVERIRAVTGGVDRVVDVDFGKNLPVTSQVLRAHGVIASYASMGDLEPKFPYGKLFQLNPSIRPVFVYTMTDAAKREAHSDIARWLAESAPVFAIANRFPLKDVVDAHLAVERGEKIGHVILDIA